LYLDQRSVVVLGLREIAGGWRGEMLGATGAFEPKLYTDPGFPAVEDLPLPGGWDHILPFRAAMCGAGLAWTPEPLVAYRRHAGQASRKINDWTSGQEVWEETLRSHSLPVMSYLRHELAHFVAHFPERRDIAAFQAVMDGLVFQSLDEWAAVRSKLRLGGWKPTWLSHAELSEVQRGREASPGSDAV
jgi:hypothetical protein